MGNRSKVLEKCYQLDRTVANEFRSCRQYLNGQAPKDNGQLMFEVLNKAVRYTLERSPLMHEMMRMANGDRTDGTTKLELSITTENWDLVQNVMKAMTVRLDEGDVLEYCLKFYLQEIKLKRCLP